MTVWDCRICHARHLGWNAENKPITPKEADMDAMPVEELLEREAGDRLLIASDVAQLKALAERVAEEFAYGDDATLRTFSDLCKEVANFEVRL